MWCRYYIIKDKMPGIQDQLRNLSGRNSQHALELKDELDAKRIAMRDELKIID
jgi:hypothetical protein